MMRILSSVFIMNLEIRQIKLKMASYTVRTNDDIVVKKFSNYINKLNILFILGLRTKTKYIFIAFHRQYRVYMLWAVSYIAQTFKTVAPVILHATTIPYMVLIELNGRNRYTLNGIEIGHIGQIYVLQHLQNLE